MHRIATLIRKELQALLQDRQSELERLIPEASERLQELGVRIRSLRGSPHLAAEAERLEALVADEAATLLRGSGSELTEPLVDEERSEPYE